MASLPPDIAKWIDSEKTIGITPDWDHKSDPRYLEILIPLSVNEVTIGGFEFRIKLSKRFVDRDCMGQLEYAVFGRRSAVELWRIDWKRFHSHPNDAFPPEFAFETFDGSHEHPFHDNYFPAEHRMRAGSLPAGRPLTADPGTVSDFLALCGQKFRIRDVTRVRLPVQTPNMFWTKT
jgi:hypothetical protein